MLQLGVHNIRMVSDCDGGRWKPNATRNIPRNKSTHGSLTARRDVLRMIGYSKLQICPAAVRCGSSRLYETIHSKNVWANPTERGIDESGSFSVGSGGFWSFAGLLVSRFTFAGNHHLPVHGHLRLVHRKRYRNADGAEYLRSRRTFPCPVFRQLHLFIQPGEFHRFQRCVGQRPARGGYAVCCFRRDREWHR